MAVMPSESPERRYALELRQIATDTRRAADDRLADVLDRLAQAAEHLADDHADDFTGLIERHQPNRA